MESSKIKQIIDSSFESAFNSWEKQIESELYPDAFVDEYSWLRVKNALKINNRFLKESLQISLTEILKDI